MNSLYTCWLSKSIKFRNLNFVKFQFEISTFFDVICRWFFCYSTIVNSKLFDDFNSKILLLFDVSIRWTWCYSTILMNEQFFIRQILFCKFWCYSTFSIDKSFLIRQCCFKNFIDEKFAIRHFCSMISIFFLDVFFVSNIDFRITCVNRKNFDFAKF